MRVIYVHVFADISVLILTEDMCLGECYHSLQPVTHAGLKKKKLHSLRIRLGENIEAFKGYKP